MKTFVIIASVQHMKTFVIIASVQHMKTFVIIARAQFTRSKCKSHFIIKKLGTFLDIMLIFCVCRVLLHKLQLSFFMLSDATKELN